MFIEQHYHTKEGILLTFIKSLNVQVYPCGRRRSTLINAANDSYYIPFDPEAKLNTEFNNRRHTSKNGFTQSFIDAWDAEKKLFSFTISGYNFIINQVEDINSFGELLIDSLIQQDIKYLTASKIYANIKLEEIPLYDSSKGLTYTTWTLRNQSVTDSYTNFAATELDRLKEETVLDTAKTDNYYFSGLSFSTEPIAGESNVAASDKFIPEVKYETFTARPQHEYSLCILTKEDGQWQLYEPAKLPRIDHGEIEDSIEVGHLNAKSIKYENHPVAVFDIKPIENNFYQLHLYEAVAKTSSQVEALTGEFSIKAEGANNILVLNKKEIALNFSKADMSVGRYMDAWWAGLKIYAPENVTNETLKNAVYRVPEGEGWSADRSFWSNKDSAETEKRQFITVWLPITQEYVERELTTGDGYLTLVYQFDWDGNGYDESAQTITFKVDVSKVILNPET